MLLTVLPGPPDPGTSLLVMALPSGAAAASGSSVPWGQATAFHAILYDTFLNNAGFEYGSGSGSGSGPGSGSGCSANISGVVLDPDPMSPDGSRAWSAEVFPPQPGAPSGRRGGGPRKGVRLVLKVGACAGSAGFHFLKVLRSLGF